ncbi:MAG: PhzF family phenazine biosynthesis protein [Alphaproteobacteria bacterium]|nr:PhzF family phenazine biosynthesis protein [Alphaproteobacteria bacterium]
MSASRQVAFRQVDVFTRRPFYGNPVAVILDGAGLSTAEMQQIAQWTNLSETTFVLPPDDPAASYQVRIFTPRAELPFAGHPTLGTAHAVLEAGIAQPVNGRLVQQCAAGLVDVAIEGDMRAFRLPRYAQSDAPEADRLAAALGGAGLLVAPPKILDVGPRWVIGECVSPAALAALTPDLAALAEYDRAHKTTGLTLFALGENGAKVRSFAPADGIAEDPVCGSGNAAVAAYQLLRGTLTDGDAYLASQGQECGRDGEIHVRISGADVHVGGHCVTCVSGVIGL